MSSTNEELAIRIKNGEKDLMSELWENTYKLLYLMSNRFYNSNTELCRSYGVEIEDIQQSCYFALCDAVEAYKTDSEYKFTAYINYSFKNAVNACLNGGQRRSVTDPLSCSTSLDVPLTEDADATKLDLIADEDAYKSFENVEDRIFTQKLNKALKQAMSDVCSTAEIDVLNRLYWNGETIATISKDCNVPYGDIQRLHSHALVKLRSSRSKQRLDPFREFIQSYAYHGVGLSSFRSSGISSVERVVEQWEEITGA